MQQWWRPHTRKIFSVEFLLTRLSPRGGSVSFFLTVSHSQALRPIGSELLIIDVVLNTVSRTRANIERMKCKLESREDLDVLNWLTPIDYAPQQSDYIRRRQKGTGQWLLDSVQFQAWLKGNTRTLFCPGIPGAGKTILTSIVIDELSARFRSDSGTGIAYIYCNFRQEDNQKVENLLASLLKQLAESYTSLPKNLKDLYDQHKPKRTSPSFDEIARTLRSVTELYSRLFIIVDALDECQPSDRKSFLEELFNLQTRQGAKIFVTSRSIPEIVDQPKSSILEIRASREDVERYLEGNMDKLLSFVRRDRSLQEDIKKGISEAVDGMFLLAQIYLDTLDDKTTPKAIRDALEYIRKRSQGLGKDREVQMLADAYDQTMERINSQKLGLKRMATRVLSWITCAKRPLTTSELQHALAVEVGKTELDEQNFTDIETMVSVCAGLVTVDEESKIIRLVHYTTQEYFEQEDFKQKHDRWFLNADQDIANTCLAYLSFNVFGAGPWQNPYPHDKYTNQVYQYGYPFYKYAAQNWGHHVQAASMEAEPLVLNFLGQEDKVCASSQIIVLSTRDGLDAEWA
ncbi:hypothetical protein F5B22DRAFT_381530 [Xylaria bambusicola]|uniref:uncharacterized protein n=1 Tax=Xylaria bambusicola TaxID=326684 RepID=UPI0020077F96|nr:uncharacterized protein F5B22DRAFT_381530 [Xylaria bambusicola]KAI0508725.1 hypothetical protein F5B22DRAFT_381530 [Xylaria bambusicola]